MILPVVCFVLGAAASLLAIRYFTHMFQLNAYKPKVQLKWLWHNSPRLWGQILLLVLAVYGWRQPLNETVLAIAFVLAGWSMRPRKAKKPLVYTHRVDRLLLTVLALTAAGFYAGWEIALFWLPLTYAAIPLLLLLADYINMPFEAWRRHTYIVKARKILKACPDLTVIGITGSYGKTSVKYYLNTLLQAQFNSLMTPESYNTPMGVVKTIRGQLKPYHEVFVCEMGAQNVGDIKELCGIACPRHGIITALGQQHLESFKSQENIIKTKYELADALPEDGFLLLNGDNELIRANPPRHRFMTYGLNDENDYRASDVKVSSRGTAFTLHTPDGQSCDFQTALLGEHNIVNLTGALAMCHLLGIPLTALKPRLLKITAVPHRLQLIDHGSFAVIDDGFNSNPNGTQAALRTLSLFDDYKIMITPGMVELGEAQETLNREFGQNAARVCDYVILVGEKQTRPIARGLADAGFPAEKLYIAESLKDGLEHSHALKTERKKIILLENDLPDNY